MYHTLSQICVCLDIDREREGLLFSEDIVKHFVTSNCIVELAEVKLSKEMLYYYIHDTNSRQKNVVYICINNSG